MILEVDFLSVRPASCLRVLYIKRVPTNRQLIAIPEQLGKLELISAEREVLFSPHGPWGDAHLSGGFSVSIDLSYIV